MVYYNPNDRVEYTPPESPPIDTNVCTDSPHSPQGSPSDSGRCTCTSLSRGSSRDSASDPAQMTSKGTILKARVVGKKGQGRIYEIQDDATGIVETFTGDDIVGRVGEGG